MTVELLFGIALGYVPCKHLYSSQLNPQLILANEDVDNFGSCTILKCSLYILILC